MSSIISVVSPVGPSVSKCGYCKRTEVTERTSHHAAGLVAHQLSAEAYMSMINLGWRRSGTFCYKPNLRRSCCPQYTIRLDVVPFKASKGHRKLLSRWNRYVLGDGARKSPTTHFDLVSSIHEAENDGTPESAHLFETILEPASFTREKYALYNSYQTEIHHDPNNSPEGFTRFLVRSPLCKQPIPYETKPPDHLPQNYGSYHQLYRLNGQLIALGVIDILPHCVSSVYFMYDKAWEKYSLGKLSALREIALVLEIRNAGAMDMLFLYMGYYIHSCAKMRYKGEYLPSYLADPETHDWFPLDNVCIPKLNEMRYVSFSHPGHSVDEVPEASPDSVNLSEDWPLDAIVALGSVENGTITVIPIKESDAWNKDSEAREQLVACFNALGLDLCQELIFNV